MELFRKPKSPFWWTDFRLKGKRYRRSTKEYDKTRATIAAVGIMTGMEATDVRKQTEAVNGKADNAA